MVPSPVAALCAIQHDGYPQRSRIVDATRMIYGKRFLIAVLARERAVTSRYLGRIYDRRAHLDTGIEEAALERDGEMVTVLCHF